jgi:hypothetical protein
VKDDPFDDPTAVAWAKHVLDDMAPKMSDSSLVVSIAPSNQGKHVQGDVKYWVELGASIMMDKPIIVVVMTDQEIPPKLALVADEVVRLPDGVNAAGSKELQDAIQRVMERLGG